MPKRRKKSYSGQFWGLPHTMARSAAFRSLSGPALKILVELHARFNGHNNGDLSLSYGEAAALLRIGKSTAKRAFDELSEKGFTKRTSDGNWYGRRAATWLVTDKSTAFGGPSTNEWKTWAPPPEPSNASHAFAERLAKIYFFGPQTAR